MHSRPRDSDMERFFFRLNRVCIFLWSVLPHFLMAVCTASYVESARSLDLVSFLNVRFGPTDLPRGLGRGHTPFVLPVCSGKHWPKVRPATCGEWLLEALPSTSSVCPPAGSRAGCVDVVNEFNPHPIWQVLVQLCKLQLTPQYSFSFNFLL